MKRVTYILLLVLLLALLTFNTVYAQGYSFRVEKEVVHVYWNKDGTMSLDYTWDFVNQPGAHPIDFVDVGMPNPNFDISTAKADVNGNPVSVSKNDYQGSGSGFAVVMGSRAIPAGRKGEVHVYVGRISQVLYPDTQDSNYASAVFGPTWFGSEYVVGNTDLTVTFHFPPGVKDNEPRWHDDQKEPQAGLDEKEQITFTWHSAQANAYTYYGFGASFPKSYVPINSIVTANAPSPSNATSPNSSDNISINNPWVWLGIIIISWRLGNNFLKSQRRKLKYLPPRIGIESHGIKRGLTAVEAAILLGTPLDKVMTMILFGIVKKEAAQVIDRDPLKLQITNPLPSGLYQYEIDFLNAFKEEGSSSGRRSLLQQMMINLIKSMKEKMRGFSLRETVSYYKGITEKAWGQVEAANTPEVQAELYGDNLEWTMLDKDYGDHTRRVFTGSTYVPHWWRHYDPTWHGAPTTTSSSSTSKGSSALPGADFAASVVHGVQTFSTKTIGNITNFTGSVTNKTHPIPHSSGGGHGGSCACAGCACACAGGGR